jgi:type IV pilus assembly protein PilM
VPVEVVNPFRNIDISGRGFNVDYLKSVAPMAAVAVGLALRGAADK